MYRKTSSSVILDREEEEIRNEGCVDSLEDEARFLAWMARGEYACFNPLESSEFDDEFALARVSTPWPISFILAKWRPIVFDLWRSLLE